MTRFVTLLLLLLPAAALAQTTYTWNGGSGNWDAAANWTPSGVPEAGDTALITADGDYTVTLNVDAEVEDLTLGSGGTGTQTLTAGAGRTLTLNGDGTIAPTGRLELDDAALDGSGALENGGVFGLYGSTASTAVTNLEGASLDVLRTSALNGAFLNQGFLTVLGDWPVGNRGELTVAEGFTNGGTITLWGNNSGTVFGHATLLVTTGTLVNEGLVRTASNVVVAGGRDERHYLRAQLDNRGEILVEERSLDIIKPGAEHFNDGLVTLDEDMVLFLTEGTYTFGPDAEVTGPGTLRLWEGTDVTFEDGVTFTANLDTTFRTATFLGGLTPASASLNPVNDGVLTFGLGGSPASGAFGHVEATGSVNTGFELTLSLVDGFIPQIGDVYTLVTGNPITGSFNPTVNTPPGLEVDLEQTSSAVTVTVTGVPVANEPGTTLPAMAALHAPAPNPSAGRTALAYDVGATGPVRMALYDALGREVAVLVDEEQAPGRYEAVLDGQSLPSGLYLVRLTTAGGLSQTRRLTRLQ